MASTFLGYVYWLSRECAQCKSSTSVTFAVSFKWQTVTVFSVTKWPSLAEILAITLLVTQPEPMQQWLMKPISDTGRLTPEQHNYNYRLSSAQLIVEITFGGLKGLWRCLLKWMAVSWSWASKWHWPAVHFIIFKEHGNNSIDELLGRHKFWASCSSITWAWQSRWNWH